MTIQLEIYHEVSEYLLECHGSTLDSIHIKAYTSTTYKKSQMAHSCWSHFLKSLQVELVLSLEDRFHFLLRCCKYCHSKVHIKDLTVYPNQELVNSALVSPVVRFLRGENYTSSEYISHILNPTKVMHTSHV